MLSNKTFIYQDHSKLHHQNPMPQSGQATMLSNKTFIYQAHPKLHHQNPMPQSGQATMALNQTRHSSTKDHSKLHHQNPMPQSGQATINSSQSNKRESPMLIPSSIIKNPIPQIQHHHLL